MESSSIWQSINWLFFCACILFSLISIPQWFVFLHLIKQCIASGNRVPSSGIKIAPFLRLTSILFIFIHLRNHFKELVRSKYHRDLGLIINIALTLVLRAFIQHPFNFFYFCISINILVICNCIIYKYITFSKHVPINPIY